MNSHISIEKKSEWIGTAIEGLATIGTTYYGSKQEEKYLKSQQEQELKLKLLDAAKQAQMTKQLQLAASQSTLYGNLSSAEIERKKQQTKTTVIIVGSAILGLTIIIGSIFIYKKQRVKK
ncbi:MAG: hypothetical protein PHT69_02000 [Bacteroidales bacterium]|nr:hypothetical protein [Bacteroidales bacterium]